MMSLAQPRRLRRGSFRMSVSSSFPIQNLMLGVRCSMFVFSVFDAQNFCSLWEKAYRLSCLTLPAHDTVALILAFDHNCYSKNKAG
jgi:hypothetical protein